MNYYNLGENFAIYLCFGSSASIHPTYNDGLQFSFGESPLPHSQTAWVQRHSLPPTPDTGRAELTWGWPITALHSFGPRDIFGNGLWPHQKQGNLWPEARTLPAGWVWSWICENVGAGMATLIFWPPGVWNWDQQSKEMRVEKKQLLMLLVESICTWG